MSKTFGDLVYGNMSHAEIVCVNNRRHLVEEIILLENGEQRIIFKCGCAYDTRPPYWKVRTCDADKPAE